MSDPAELPPATGELRQLQLLELQVLTDFARLCERNGLRYFLAYGTLLGAVRHRGFIPWDDDIDVAMPRDDLQCLADILSRESDARYILQSYRTTEHYPNVFPKLALRGTRLHRSDDPVQSFERGVGIDVFPLDGAPSSSLARRFRRLIVRAFQVRLSLRKTRSGRRPPRMNRRLISLVPVALFAALYERTVAAWPASTTSAWICAGPYPKRQTFPSAWFGEGARIKFEGVDFAAPVEWDAYLTQVYGEYMRYPAEDKRVSQHSFVGVDLGDVPATPVAEPQAGH